MKPNNLIYVKCTKESFFRAWIEVLTPYHRLTSREREVAARILLQYFAFKDSVIDKDVLLDLLWSRRSRKDMMDSLHMTQAHFQVVVTKLKSTGFLDEDSDINPRYIPHMVEGDSRFLLQFVYDWSSQGNPVRKTDES